MVDYWSVSFQNQLHFLDGTDLRGNFSTNTAALIIVIYRVISLILYMMGRKVLL